jgi:hypothetical protein
VANDDARGTVAESEASPQLDIWALDPDVATLIAEGDAIGFLSDDNPDDNPGRRKQPVVTFAARVFVHRRRVALMLAVHPLSPLSTRQIQVIGEKLTEKPWRSAKPSSIRRWWPRGAERLPRRLNSTHRLPQRCPEVGC